MAKWGEMSYNRHPVLSIRQRLRSETKRYNSAGREALRDVKLSESERLELINNLIKEVDRINEFNKTGSRLFSRYG